MNPEHAGEPRSEPPTTRIRLDIAYDGGNFTGWATQPTVRTVQGAIEDALAVILRRHAPVASLVVAGRTDAGVHATGQVAHLDLTPAQLRSLDRPRRGKLAGRVYDGPASLGRRINGIAGLDGDVYVARSALALPGFDARFSALWRRYEYRIADTAAPRNPLDRHRTLWYPAALDVGLMNQAAASLLGLHDWAAYCKPREGATTVRDLEEFWWDRDTDGVLVARVQADAFCHSMVRSLVGACVAAGQGNLPVERLAGIRDELARGSEFKVMPAKGLVLVEVGYPETADGLQVRAELTRNRRPKLDVGRSAPGRV
ncbi:tRNA pseudouridine(38-40) synthase TruA [Marisediminicola sp. UYEF4]|uniref:tRNA pseudouridine(38-40) synthase TruA n=1 Tax=Marisediminicola sp. UYEF4 TaxID=1756384 RepID=UPI003399847F